MVLVSAIGLIVLPFVNESQRRTWPCALAIVLACLALLYLLAFCVAVWGDSSESDQAFGLEAADLIAPGWGLYLAWLSAIAGLGFSIALLIERRGSRRMRHAGYVPQYPPGWYRHPDGAWRWWDGYRWTEHRA